LYSCGQNNSAELGWGYRTESNQPLSKDKTIIKPSYSFIDYILSGDTFSFFVLKDGSFLRCGSNSEGYIGAGEHPCIETPSPVTNPPWGNARISKITFGYYHTVVLANNIIYSSGKVPGEGVRNVYEPISSSVVETIGKIVDVASGVFHTICLNGEYLFDKRL